MTVTLRSLSPDGWKRVIEDSVEKRKLSVLQEALEMYSSVHNRYGNQDKLRKWLTDALTQSILSGWKDGAMCLARLPIVDRSDPNVFRQLGMHGRLDWAVEMADQNEKPLTTHQGSQQLSALLRGAVQGNQHHMIVKTLTMFPEIWHNVQYQHTILEQAVGSKQCGRQLLDTIYNHCLESHPLRKDRFHDSIVDGLRNLNKEASNAIWALDVFKRDQAREDTMEMAWHAIAISLCAEQGQLKQVFMAQRPQTLRHWDAVLPMVRSIKYSEDLQAIKDMVCQTDGDIVRLMWSWRMIQQGKEYVLFDDETLAHLSKQHEDALFLINPEKTAAAMQRCFEQQWLNGKALQILSRVEHTNDTPERQAWREHDALNNALGDQGQTRKKKVL